MEGSQPRKTRFSRIFVIAVFAIAALIVTGSIVLMGFSLRDFVNAKENMVARHVEATNAITFAYMQYLRNGYWPTAAEVQAADPRAASLGWQYESDSGLGAPVIWLHGPYHTILTYYFEPPSQNGVTQKWMLSLEGDKSYFMAEARYAAK